MNVGVNVLIVIGQLEVGGTERHLLSVLPSVQGDGISCAVYCLRGGGALADPMQASGVRVISPAHHSRRWLGLLRTAWHLVATLRAERPDIVHFFLPEAYLLGGLCSLVGPPCVRVMSRRSLNRYQRKWVAVRAIERYLHGRMDCVLANSAAVANELRDEGIADAVVGIIYNGVDLPTERTAAADAEFRHALDIPGDALVLVMVANLIKYKGHADVIEALHRARIQMPENWVILMIGGDRGIQEDLARQVVATELANHVRWLGAVSDVQPYLSIADIALTISHEEGFSNAVLEAMAASVALIVTAVGGNAEAVIDGETGIVVPVHDPAALAVAIVDLAHDNRRRNELGRAAHARVAAHFAMPDCISAYRRVYQGLAQGLVGPVRDVIGAGT